MKHLLIAIMLTLSINATEEKASFGCAYQLKQMKKDSKRVRMDLEIDKRSFYTNSLIYHIQGVLVECENVLDKNTTALLHKRRKELVKLR